MTAAEVFSAFMDAQKQKGYQYFVLLFRSGLKTGEALSFTSAQPERWQISQLDSHMKNGFLPLGIVGIPSISGHAEGIRPYKRQFLPDDWVDGHLQRAIDEGVFSREQNPHLWR